jgi:hypothetical protein
MERQETLTQTELREKRLQELLNSCQQHVLQQIVGPFGLNAAMFEDKRGGNVTTKHNFEDGVVATELDQQRYDQWQEQKKNFDRSAYDKDLPKKRKDTLKSSEPIVSAYTGSELPRDGRYELDHVVPTKAIELDSGANLFMSSEQRVESANQSANLVPAEKSINASMQDMDKPEWAEKKRKKDPGKTNAESFGVDMELLVDVDTKAKSAISRDLLVAQIKKQGSELAVTGAKDAGKNALRQAMGVVLNEFVSQMFKELKDLLKNRNDGSNFIDDLIAAINRVLLKVKEKISEAIDAAKNGALQGFMSNLLTFLINNFITTSAKIVSVIREGMSGLWKAIKMMVNPPENMSSMEVARTVSKILAAVVTTSLGMMFEEAIKNMLLAAAPFLAPLIDIVSTAVTAILTGIVSALVVYGLDRFFDWLSAKGTELLQAYESNLDAMKENLEKMAQWVELQYESSENYKRVAYEYRLIEVYLAETQEAQQRVIDAQTDRVSANNLQLSKLKTSISHQVNDEQDLMLMLESYISNEEK